MGDELAARCDVPWRIYREELDHIFLDVPNKDLAFLVRFVPLRESIIRGRLLLSLSLFSILFSDLLLLGGLSLEAFLSRHEAVALGYVADAGRVAIFVAPQLRNEFVMVRHDILLLGLCPLSLDSELL